MPRAEDPGQPPGAETEARAGRPAGSARSASGRVRPATALAWGVLAVTVTAWAAPPYRDGPPPGHTGGFGEPLCAECHFGGPVNAEPGTLSVATPDRYEPGETHSLTVRLRHPEMAAAGFQLAVRFADEPRAGEQAGTLGAPSVRASTGAAMPSRTAVTVDSLGVEYAHQTLDGAALTGPGVAEWTVEWTAPESEAAVVVHVAGNAANDDASEFGDFVYAREARIPARVDDSAVPAQLWLFDSGP